MKLLDTHAFNCIVLMVTFGRTSCEDIPLALTYNSFLILQYLYMISEALSSKVIDSFAINWTVPVALFQLFLDIFAPQANKLEGFFHSPVNMVLPL